MVATLSPQLLFVESFSIKGLVDGVKKIPNPHVNTKKASKFFLGVINIAIENIGKRLDIISKYPKVFVSHESIARRNRSLREFFSQNLWSDDNFFDNFVKTFVENVLTLR